MPFDIGSLGMSAANSVIGTGMGLLLEKHNDKRQLRQQQALNDQQEAMARRMSMFNLENQMSMWEKTGPVGQMEQLKKAGLNPGLIYGGSGGGGQTSNVDSSSGNSSQAPSGGGEAIAAMGLQLQNSMLAAQIENIKADTNKKNVEATYTGGAQTANTEVDTILKGVKTEFEQLNLELGTNSYKANLARIRYETDKALQELQLLQNQGIVAENTTMDRIAQIGAEAVGSSLRNELVKSQTKLSDEQRNKVLSDIDVNKATIQNWLVQQAQGWNKLSLDERNTAVNELLGQFNTSLSREALGAVGGIISTILSRGLSKGVKKTNIVINRQPGE